MCNRTHANPTKLGPIRSSESIKNVKRLRKAWFPPYCYVRCSQLTSDYAPVLIMIVIAVCLQRMVTDLPGGWVNRGRTVTVDAGSVTALAVVGRL
jgi:hypothetical protein